MSGLYAVDGSINVTVVDGSSWTGLEAADGSWNVVASNGSSFVGVQHPCGAYWVTPTSSASSVYAPDGSLNVQQSPYGSSGPIKITVVSGSFTPGSSSTPTYYILGF